METQIPDAMKTSSDEQSWDSRDDRTTVNTDKTLVPGATSMSNEEQEWNSRDDKTTVDTDKDVYIRREKAWNTTHQELERCETVAGHLEHFVVGGELVRRLNGAGNFISQDGEYRPHEYCVTWS